MLHCNVGHSANHIFGAIERRAIRQLCERHEISLILRGNKSCGHTREAENGKPDQAGVHHNGNQARPQRARDKHSVTARCAAKGPVEKFEKPAKRKLDGTRKAVLLGVVRLQQKRRERRTQRERIKRGNHRRDGDGQRELLVELA